MHHCDLLRVCVICMVLTFVTACQNQPEGMGVDRRAVLNTLHPDERRIIAECSMYAFQIEQSWYTRPTRSVLDIEGSVGAVAARNQAMRFCLDSRGMHNTSY